MLFRKIICSRDRDPTNISQIAKNLLANMRDGAPPFSVIDFIWEEIKGISMNPQKTSRFAPYLMFMIEDVTNRTFPKDRFHMTIRHIPSKKPIVPTAQVSSPPGHTHLHSSTEQQNRVDWHGLSVRPVEVTRGSPPPNSVKNPPLQSRRCMGFCLECVTLTMLLRQDFMRRGRLGRNFKNL
jgi:hypothetical protein